MKNKPKKFLKELKVKSSTDNLTKIRDFTKGAADECGLSDDVIGKIILAVDEACTNVIKHAYKYSKEGEIVIRIKLDNNKFSITISDKGKRFNPELIPDPDLRKYHREKKSGGLGMFLMKKLMDEVTYNLTEKKNQVVLVKYLT